MHTNFEVLTLPRRLEHDDPQPPRGSVIMAHGLEGTAYQRWFSTGRWYRAGSEDSLSWETVKRLPNLYLVVEGPSA